LSKIKSPASQHLLSLNFAPANFFSFSRGAKFGEFRSSAPAQVVWRLPVRKWQWSEIA
jgi:hypothetical protein